MLVICLLSVIAAAALLWCIAAAASRAWRPLRDRSLVFLPPSAAAPFEEFLAAGDLESAYRVMKALEGRGDVHIVESEREILVAAAEPLPPVSLKRASVD